MFNLLNKSVIALGLCVIGTAHADSILKYEKVGSSGDKQTITVSITGRWLRIDNEGKEKPDYTLMDTGRLIMFEVDDDAKRYTATRMNKAYWPDMLPPKLMPVQEKATVSGIRCQKVHEMGTKAPKAEHCMTAGVQLGLNARETITLSRLLMVTRKMGWDWNGVSTPDERQVSVQSRSLDGNMSLTFKSVEHKAIPDNRVKIPDTYKQNWADQKKPAK
ncbi:MAG: hypothetical protein KZQ85_14020 [Candidatus Thiodiazotropha sp. (ex Myrtea sp. 'scaly one' KF741663)]|nr:hypothetical protein [Candidatus Thiodiazotropha sp. (ex Myrtea sp. 'scaly one' KF741663)]